MPSLELPRILWNDLGRSATVVASSAAAGFPAKAAQNDNTYEFWKPTAVPATYRWDFGAAKVFSALAIGVHDLKTVGASVQAQYSYNDVDWLDASDVHTPTDNSEILLLFPPQSARYARARFTGAVPTIGLIKIGPVLSVEDGIDGSHAPLPLSRKTELEPSQAERGQWLGSSVIRSGLAGDAEWRGLGATWYRTYFTTFVLECRSRARPFFFAWLPSAYPQDVAYCMLDSDVAPTFKPGGLVDVRIKMKGADRLA